MKKGCTRTKRERANGEEGKWQRPVGWIGMNTSSVGGMVLGIKWLFRLGEGEKLEMGWRGEKKKLGGIYWNAQRCCAIFADLNAEERLVPDVDFRELLEASTRK